MKRPGHRNFNAVSHKRARPEVLFSNLKHGSRIGGSRRFYLSFFFFTIFGTAMSRQAKENVCDTQSIPVRLHCRFENCHKSYNSKKHTNEHFLSTAMDRHVLNSKTAPQAARRYGIRR